MHRFIGKLSEKSSTLPNRFLSAFFYSHTAFCLFFLVWLFAKMEKKLFILFNVNFFFHSICTLYIFIRTLHPTTKEGKKKKANYCLTIEYWIVNTGQSDFQPRYLSLSLCFHAHLVLRFEVHHFVIEWLKIHWQLKCRIGVRETWILVSMNFNKQFHFFFFIVYVCYFMHIVYQKLYLLNVMYITDHSFTFSFVFLFTIWLWSISLLCV